MTFNSTKMLLCMTVVGAYCAAAYSTEERKAISNSLVIARVDGVPIYDHQIKVRPEEVESFATALEIEKLDRRIKELIETKAIQKLGIHVQEDEIRKEVNAKFGQAGIDKEEARRISGTYRTLLSALERWHQDKTHSASIYKEMLADSMTEAQWHQWQVCYPVPEKIAELRALVPNDLEHMKENSLCSSKRDLLHAKLIAYITAGVRVEENEVRTLYADKYKGTTEKPQFSEVKNKLEAEMLEGKKQQAIVQWWQARMREVNIEIKDKRLKRSWEAMNPGCLLHTPQPPEAVVVLPETDATP